MFPRPDRQNVCAGAMLAAASGFCAGRATGKKV
jgi:hypothetical protein